MTQYAPTDLRRVTPADMYEHQEQVTARPERPSVPHSQQGPGSPTPIHSPVRIDSSQVNHGPVEMIDLFEIDGVMYQITSKPRMNIALKYLWEARTIGEVPAATNLLVKLVGEEAFQALVNYDDLTPAQFQTIVDGATKIAIGELTKSLGNSDSGPSK